MILDKESNIILSVERAANDLRKGFPVLIEGEGGNVLAVSPETVGKPIINKLLNIGSLDLVVAKNRAKFLSDGKIKHDASLSLSSYNISDVATLSGLADTSAKLKEEEFVEISKQQSAALKLVKISELIPSVITIEINESLKDENILSVNVSYIEQYSDLISYKITEACRTKIALKSSVESEIVAYRPNIGGIEHYAIIVGKNIPKNPLVRVHSSCYTGDLLDSLACDCHDQLHLAIDLMNKNGGGIILYMLQEGRGIGLINKLRAYALKEKGFDTVDANEILGFDDDERLFIPAAEILKKMGINQIKLLTNNPKKASGLEDCGIKVSECISHVMVPNMHNENYLKTKSTRLGHKMGGEDK